MVGQKITEGTLAEFLRAKREALSPADVGVPERARRRTKGLRREEVAELAGIGASWYTALEQGRNANPSDHLLRQLARALRLTSAETKHLFFLAGRSPPSDSFEVEGPVSPALQHLLDILHPRPAFIADRRWDWLAWNQAADVFFEFEPVEHTGSRNTLWHFFTGKRHMPDAEWQDTAHFLVKRLRVMTMPWANDPWFEQFVHELMTASEDFRTIWHRYEVGDISENPRSWRSEKFGSAEFELITLQIPALPGAWLLIFLIDDEQAEALGAATAKLAHRKAGQRSKTVS